MKTNEKKILNSCKSKKIQFNNCIKFLKTFWSSCKSSTTLIYIKLQKKNTLTSRYSYSNEYNLVDS